MDLSPITSKIASAATAVKTAAGSAATGIQKAVVWSGHKVVWLVGAVFEGIKAGANSVAHFAKASWHVVCKGVQSAWHTSSPYIASTASFFKANLVKLGAFLTSAPGVALIGSVAAVLLANSAIQDIAKDKHAKAVALVALALLSATATGIVIAPFFPVLV